MIEISKSYTFDSAHMLWVDELTPEENFERFGKCSRLHGHTYHLDVLVMGSVNEDGMVLNYFDLDQIVKPYVDNVLDHRFLNEVFPDMLTTAENMAERIAGTLATLLETHPEVSLGQVTLSETLKTSAVWTP